MNLPKIIGIHGKARTGKDTLAQLIIKNHGGYRYGFADPIKSMIANGLGIFDGDFEKEEPILGLGGSSYRKLLQTLGTDWGREMIHPDIWLRSAELWLEEINPVSVVIPDVRFENEAKWIRDLNGLVIHLTRPDAIEVRQHKSEHGIEFRPSDIAIHNDGSIDDLYRKFQEAIGD